MTTNTMTMEREHFRFRNSYLSYFMMYSFYYLSWALFSALISVYLMGLGFSGTEVSLVVSASYLSSMIAQPFIGTASDRFGIKKVNLVLFLLAALGGIFFMTSRSLITIAVSYSFVLLLINGANPTMERIASCSPYSYGKIRIWGTIGYALGSQLAGLIYDYISASAIFKVFVVTMIAAVIGTYGTEPSFETGETESAEKVSPVTLLMNKKYLYYLAVYGLYSGIASMCNTYAPSFFTSEGLSASLTSTILSLAVMCELPLILFSWMFMDKIPSKVLILTAVGVTVLQFASYGLNLPLPVQIIATFVAKHPMGMLLIMTNLKVVNSIVDQKIQITALAVVAAVKSLTGILFQTAGGAVLDACGYQNLFLIFTGALVLVLAMASFMKLPSGNNSGLFKK